MPLPEPLNSLSPEDQLTVASFMVGVHFDEGTRIFGAGDPGDGCYLIDEGSVRIELPRPELDSEGVLGYSDAGSLLGELSLLDGLPRSASAWAETAVNARKFTSDDVSRLAGQHPVLAMSLMHALGRDAARKLRTSTDRLSEHLFDARGGGDPEVEDMVTRSAAAQAEFADWPEPRVDALLTAITREFLASSVQLATSTVRETRLGNVPDKVAKNYIASAGVLKSLLGRPGTGRLETADDAATGSAVTELAAPVGVIFGMVPVTNPVATTIFKTLIALKGRNSLVLSPNRTCMGVCTATVALIRGELEKAGAPVDLVQSVTARTSRRKTARFMNHPGVSLILATGGPGMVEAAYASGTPAIGVGSGNAPTWIAADADIAAAAGSVVYSKSFDNGLICGSEHNLVVDAAVRDSFVAALEMCGAAVLSEAETASFTAEMVNPDGHSFRARIIGKDAATLATAAGITRDHPIKVIVVPTAADLASAYAGEKMAPVLSLFTVTGDDEALNLSLALLRHQGTGHTAIVHSTDPDRINRFAGLMPASRILVNSPGAQGVSGVTTGLTPSFTLGCGTFGGTSTTDNVTYTNLLNIKRVAQFVAPDPAVLALTMPA